MTVLRRWEPVLTELERLDPVQALPIRQAVTRLSRLCDRLGEMADAGLSVDDAVRTMIFAELHLAIEPVREYMRTHCPQLLNETQH